MSVITISELLPKLGTLPAREKCTLTIDRQFTDEDGCPQTRKTPMITITFFAHHYAIDPDNERQFHSVTKREYEKNLAST